MKKDAHDKYKELSSQSAVSRALHRTANHLQLTRQGIILITAIHRDVLVRVGVHRSGALAFHFKHISFLLIG